MTGNERKQIGFCVVINCVSCEIEISVFGFFEISVFGFQLAFAFEQ